MKIPKRIYLLAFAVAIALIGIIGSRSFNRIVAQPTYTPEWLTATQGKQNTVAWKRKERSVATINSKFKLNLPSFLPDADWIVGVKPVAEGEKEKMYVGIITWQDAIDKEGKGKGLGFKTVSKMEDYPEESIAVAYGEASFANILDSNQTLVIYLEVAPPSEIVVTQNGKEMVLKASEGSSVIFDGNKESVKLESPAFLLNEMQIKKLKKEVEKAGHAAKIKRKEIN